TDEAKVDLPEQCRVAVIYEDEHSKNLALNLCNQLHTQFWDDLGFQFSWWHFRFLDDPRLAAFALEEASMADVLLFAVQPVGDIPRLVKGWIDQWLEKRRRSTGALATLASAVGPATMRGSYLERIARRAGLDYLPLTFNGSINPLGIASYQPLFG